MPTRRQFIGAIAGAVAGSGAAARAQAPGAAPATVDGWPARSVRVISPTGTGGPGQNFRLYADQLKDTFGQSFVLENMPGGSGAIGSMAVARVGAGRPHAAARLQQPHRAGAAGADEFAGQRQDATTRRSR